MPRPGSILIAPETLNLAEGYVVVKPLGARPVKGLDVPLEVFEVVAAGTARSRLQATAARGLTRFVGRDAELEQLRQALERARTGHGQVVAVVGDPGVGKSRLFWEFTHSHRTHGWLVVESISVSYGKATSFLPLIELLRTYFQIESSDDARKTREKVTGKLLSLDRALEPSLPGLLCSGSWRCPSTTLSGSGLTPHSAVNRRSMASGGCSYERARSSRSCWC